MTRHTSPPQEWSMPLRWTLLVVFILLFLHFSFFTLFYVKVQADIKHSSQADILIHRSIHQETFIPDELLIITAVESTDQLPFIKLTTEVDRETMRRQYTVLAPMNFTGKQGDRIQAKRIEYFEDNTGMLGRFLWTDNSLVKEVAHDQ